ncbi:MAG: isoprenyl transferase [Deltaproteobacteria bacterium]|nr:isoprenyl transferase [Deltaproteobacteria bacterium]
MAYDGPVPRHLAIIMDGNGRWAQAQGLPRERGHEAGADSVREILRISGELGIEVLTLYSFSTENWKRPVGEVRALMGLLERYLSEEREELRRNNVRLRAIGQIDRLPLAVRLLLKDVGRYTAGNTGIQLVLALSYGGRHELVEAAKALARRVQRGELKVDAIDEDAFAGHLATAGLPDPDLLIRTSGEHRLSNFLPWQLAYSELYVTDVHWPEFRRPHLEEALASYGKRERRFGQTGAQLRSSP